MRNLLIVVVVGLLGFFAYGTYRDGVARRQREAAGAAARAATPRPAASYRTMDRSARAGRISGSPPARAEATEHPAPGPVEQPGRRCDGRIYCSQMTSCAEATWFIQNCAGTQMDGEGDGVPCERQWCKRQ